MNDTTYYRDHWVEVEPERVAAYKEMFRWRPEMAPLLAPADLQPGQTVVDYGCGPGGLLLELARRTTASGHVHGVDLNREFVQIARQAMTEARFGGFSSVHHAPDDRIPLPDASVDRLVCKNVMEYVPDIATTLREFRRVMKPGGVTHLIDSDWGMLVVEPLGADKIAELFAAAKLAYHTPHAGRMLYSEMKKAGFKEVSVKILTNPDTTGQALPVLHNMVNYAKIGGKIDPKRADQLLSEVRQSITDGLFMLVLPQFLVTGQA